MTVRSLASGGDDGALGEGELGLAVLGGLGEIGMNCLVLEQRAGARTDRMLIDCGVIFPSSDLGIELYRPRFDYLLDDPSALSGVVLTHGHEDHFGAMPMLLAARDRAIGERAPPLVVTGAGYAIELLRMRLEEIDYPLERVILRAVTPGERFSMGSFSVEPLRVTHSVVDSLALAVGTAAGRVVHTGDFKLDPDPPDGEPTDEARLAALGDEGVALLLSDSTNALVEGCAEREKKVAAALERVVGAASGRVVVGLFASNAHRLEALGAAARAHRRKICLLGRSMHAHSDVARRLGRLSWPSDLLTSPELAARLPRHQILYAATGTQGEPRAALRRLASGQHHELSLEAGDTVIMSSRTIPGNERAVHAMLDDLVARGAKLVTWYDDRSLHASGHAHRDEQRRMIELVRPAAFVPLHGTRLHLEAHAAMARQLGVPEVKVLVNGDAARFSAGRLRIASPVTAGKVAIGAGLELDDETLRERQRIGRAGVVFVAIARRRKGRPRIEVRARGLGAAAEREAERAAREALASGRGRMDASRSEAIERSVRRRIGELTGGRPLVDVVWIDE